MPIASFEDLRRISALSTESFITSLEPCPTVIAALEDPSIDPQSSPMNKNSGNASLKSVPPPESTRHSSLHILTLAAVMGAMLVAARYFGAAPLRGLLQWISDLGSTAPLVFVPSYVAACVLFIPGSILTLSAGFLFGVVRGSIYVSIAATLGATMAFLIGRYAARQWVVERLASYPKFKAVDRAVAHEGWKIVALTRLSPLFPFNLLNYAFGLTNVRVRDYVIASWAGTLPGTIVYVYLGSLAADLTRAATGGSQRSPAEWALYALGLLATIAVVVYVTRVSTRALKQFSETENG
jgi:uncharacterized membrane protein YdjX (TVP38/TMEM64 family)